MPWQKAAVVLHVFTLLSRQGARTGALIESGISSQPGVNVDGIFETKFSTL